MFLFDSNKIHKPFDLNRGGISVFTYPYLKAGAPDQRDNIN